MRMVIRYISAVALAVSMFSCSKSQPVVDEVVELNPVIESKSTTDGVELTNFGIYLLASSAPHTYACGEYEVAKGTTGELDTVTPIYCIARKDYNYLVSSPKVDFVAPLSASCGGGVKVERCPSEPLYLSEAGNRISLDGMHMSGNNVLAVNQTLKQRLSKVTFKMYNTLADDVVGYDIHSVTLTNVLSEAIFCPTHTYHPANSDNTAVFEFTGKGTNSFNVAKSETVTLMHDGEESFTFVANDYLSDDIPVPTLKIVFRNADGKRVDVPINIDMKPQCRYTFTINLASTTIYIKVTVNSDWSDDGYSTTGKVEEVGQYTIDISDDQWDDNDHNIIF